MPASAKIIGMPVHAPSLAISPRFCRGALLMLGLLLGGLALAQTPKPQSQSPESLRQLTEKFL